MRDIAPGAVLEAESAAPDSTPGMDTAGTTADMAGAMVDMAGATTVDGAADAGVAASDGALDLVGE